MHGHGRLNNVTISAICVTCSLTMLSLTQLRSFQCLGDNVLRDAETSGRGLF